MTTHKFRKERTATGSKHGCGCRTTMMNKCKYHKERNTIFVGLEIPEHNDVVCTADYLKTIVTKCGGDLEKCWCSSIRIERDAELEKQERMRELLDVTEGDYPTFFTEDEESGGLRISADALPADIILHGDGTWEIV